MKLKPWENMILSSLSLPQIARLSQVGWVYTVKTGPKKAETFKARYVGKRYFRIPGIDYHETFSPTARMNSIRVLFQYAVQNYLLVQNATLP